MLSKWNKTANLAKDREKASKAQSQLLGEEEAIARRLQNGLQPRGCPGTRQRGGFFTPGTGYQGLQQDTSGYRGDCTEVWLTLGKEVRWPRVWTEPKINGIILGRKRVRTPVRAWTPGQSISCRIQCLSQAGSGKAVCEPRIWIQRGGLHMSNSNPSAPQDKSGPTAKMIFKDFCNSSKDSLLFWDPSSGLFPGIINSKIL